MKLKNSDISKIIGLTLILLAIILTADYSSFFNNQSVPDPIAFFVSLFTTILSIFYVFLAAVGGILIGRNVESHE